MKNLLCVSVLIAVISCSNNVQKNDRQPLQDGWYISAHDGKGIKREFAGDTIILRNTPSIPFSSIVSVKPELKTHLDSALELSFILTENGEQEWQTVIRDPGNQQVYFALDDTLINLHTVFTDFKHTKAAPLGLTLGYSDFSTMEAERIVQKIGQRLKK